VRKGLLNGFNLEIGGGLGPLKGLVWRLGLMGYSSTLENVLLALASLEKMLASEGYKVEPGAGVKAAVEYMKKH
jgi:alanine-glyoxylate transaminase/serine-glyoxylate transaminase/serine-pyruvate transaminase